MARGHPDWNVNVDWYAFFDIDSAELAARLSSPVTFLRSGRVVHIDPCIDGIVTWEEGTYGTGAQVLHDTQESFRYDSCIKLIAGSDATAGASVAKNIPLPALSNCGIEITFQPTLLAYEFRFVLTYYDGTSFYKYDIKLDMVAKTISYRNSENTFTKIDDIGDFAAKGAYWHTLKLIVDLVNLKYDKVYLDGENWSLADIAGYTTADTATPHIEATIRGGGGGGNNPQYRINDFIFTIDEP